MKQMLTVALCIALVSLVLAPAPARAQAGDTLVVYAMPLALNDVIVRDTVAGGFQAHKVYKLVSRDTTYLYTGPITVKSDITVLGVLDPTTKRPPCIQPAVRPDLSIPANPFTLTGKGKKGVFKNLYLLNLATNGSASGDGVGIQVSADSIAVTVDNCVFEEWQTFAIGYNGNWCKFTITNNKFRNMVHPNQWYIGEVLRNEWPGTAYTDSVIFRYNTMFCVNGYSSATVTKYYTKYFEFVHNSVIYSFKNVFFEFNTTKGKFNNNLFYAPWGGGISKAEYPWWDQLWSPEIGSVIDLDTLDLAKDSLFNPSDIGNVNHRMLSEAKRTVEAKNNAYFWPTTLTNFWKSWNDTAHVDSIYTPTWMNARTTNMFSDKTHWPGFTQSGNVNADPGFGTTIPAILNTGQTNTSTFLDWFTLIRRGQTPTIPWGYKRTAVGSAANWVPTWPLPESNDMKYTNAALKTGATDGGPIGDPNWFGIVLDVQEYGTTVPEQYELGQNYPNPFNPSTKIRFAIPTSSFVTLKVYNVLGQEVANLVNQNLTPGSYEVSFDASRLPSGMYMYRVDAGKFSSTKKMVLVK
jgi:hypothetical protein